MLKRQALILTRWFQQVSSGSGPNSDDGVRVPAPRRRDPGGRGSSIALPEPDPEMFVRAVRQSRRTR